MAQKSKNDNKEDRLFGFLIGDFAASAISATLVAPIVTIIDRAIVEKASSNQPVLRGLGRHALLFLKRPGGFFFSRPFGIVWTLYAVTYGVANSAESISGRISPEHVGSVIFASTFLVNVPLGVRKDMRFVQLFGNNQNRAGAATPPTPATIGKAAKAAIPKLGSSRWALATFLVRDALTIFGSFTLAPRLAAAIPDSIASSPQAQNTITQLSVPAVIQLVSTPLHMLGLDLAARPYDVAWSDRIKNARMGLLSSTIVRCIRILPAFGFGCIANAELRKTFHENVGQIGSWEIPWHVPTMNMDMEAL